MLAYIIVAIIAYLIGSVNFSIIISKKMAGFDVREKGSGNAGTTNMLRSVGKKAAAITLICDILNCRNFSCNRTYFPSIFRI